MKIKIPSNIKAPAIVRSNCSGRRVACRVLRVAATTAAVLGTLAIAAWATTITAANTNNRSAKSLFQAGTVRPAGGTPQYQIFDIGVVDVGDSFSQGFGVSLAGVSVGRSVRNGGSPAFSRTP